MVDLSVTDFRKANGRFVKGHHRTGVATDAARKASWPTRLKPNENPFSVALGRFPGRAMRQKGRKHWLFLSHDVKTPFKSGEEHGKTKAESRQQA